MSNALTQFNDVAQKLKERTETRRLEFYDPYPFQARFHDAKDMQGGAAMQRLLMAGNQVGKSDAGAVEVACHATGIYPPNWKGHRFSSPRLEWCGGQNNDKVRDICQAKLLGDPTDLEDFGKGWIPRECILSTQRKPGIPDAFESVLIRHKSGVNCRIAFKSYDAGKADWMGEPPDVIWLDEEPPLEIFSQALVRGVARNGILYLTFTPENGMTEVVNGFMNNLKPGQALYRAGWDDARHPDGRTHLSAAVMEQLVSVMPPHEVAMRKRGEPVLGEGMVFPIPVEEIMCDPFPIPDHYARIAGLDFGWDHPTAVAWEAYNKETDTAYIYDVYRRSKEVPAIHAEAIKTRGAWIPVVWPHDGHRNTGQKDRGDGVTVAAQYRSLGVNMMPRHFTNPPDASGKLNFAVEPGIFEMFTRMRTGRLKVFSTLTPWFDEFRGYYRKDGQIVKINDDLMSASRYGVQSLRMAAVLEEKRSIQQFALGTSDYDPLSVY